MEKDASHADPQSNTISPCSLKGPVVVVIAVVMDPNTPAVSTDRAAVVANRFFATSSALLVIATLLFTARIWTRCLPGAKMLADDYVCVLAYVCFLPLYCSGNSALMCKQIFIVTTNGLFFKSIEFRSYDSTRSKLTIANIEDASFYSIIGQPFWAWSMAAIKISIALMLIRLEPGVRWRRFLWAMVALQVVLTMYNTLAQFLGCIPFHKTWDFTGAVPGKCWPMRTSFVSQITVQAFVVFTDWVFALMPISFIRKIHRPLRERIVIGVLMGLGIFAGAASLVKIEKIYRLSRTHSMEDVFLQYVTIEMWCSIEALVGFIASCVPCLRGPSQRLLEHYGLVSPRPPNNYTSFAGQVYRGPRQGTHTTGGTETVVEPPIRMKSMKRMSSDGDSVVEILPSGRVVGKKDEIWRTTEVHMEREQRWSAAQMGTSWLNAANAPSAPSAPARRPNPG